MFAAQRGDLCLDLQYLHKSYVRQHASVSPVLGRGRGDDREIAGAHWSGTLAEPMSSLAVKVFQKLR